MLVCFLQIRNVGKLELQLQTLILATLALQRWIYQNIQRFVPEKLWGCALSLPFQYGGGLVVPRSLGIWPSLPFVPCCALSRWFSVILRNILHSVFQKLAGLNKTGRSSKAARPCLGWNICIRLGNPACVESMASDRNMRGKVRQLLIKEPSARKREAKGTLFETFGFYCFCSR